jgi:hypothetical protein
VSQTKIKIWSRQLSSYRAADELRFIRLSRLSQLETSPRDECSRPANSDDGTDASRESHTDRLAKRQDARDHSLASSSGNRTWYSPSGTRSTYALPRASSVPLATITVPLRIS